MNPEPQSAFREGAKVELAVVGTGRWGNGRLRRLRSGPLGRLSQLRPGTYRAMVLFCFDLFDRILNKFTRLHKNLAHPSHPLAAYPYHLVVYAHNLMTYPTISLFQGIPTMYSSLPSKQHKRRTATNIMAGYFDPLPALPSDFERDNTSSSCGSLASATDQAERKRVIDGVNVSRARATMSGEKGKQGWRRPAVKRATDAGDGKEAQSRRFIPAEKENAVSDSDSAVSHSSPPVPMDLLPTELASSKPKASGFWRARSSNISEAPAPSTTLKRKRSGDNLLLPEKRQALQKDPKLPVHPVVSTTRSPVFSSPPIPLGPKISSWTSISSISSIESDSGSELGHTPESSTLTHAEYVQLLFLVAT